MLLKTMLHLLYLKLYLKNLLQKSNKNIITKISELEDNDAGIIKSNITGNLLIKLADIED